MLITVFWVRVKYKKHPFMAMMDHAGRQVQILRYGFLFYQLIHTNNSVFKYFFFKKWWIRKLNLSFTN